MALVEGFSSAPIRLAALISDRKRQARTRKPTNSNLAGQRCEHPKQLCSSCWSRSTGFKRRQHYLSRPLLFVLAMGCCHLLLPAVGGSWSASSQQQVASLRHQTHYMNIIPSTHFQYREGRQQPADESTGPALEARSSADEAPAPAEEATWPAHIYKRSSALLSAPTGFVAPRPSLHYAPLVSSSHPAGPLGANAFISRRMMSDAGQARLAWHSGESDESSSSDPLLASSSQQQVRLAELKEQPHQLQPVGGPSAKLSVRNPRQEAELLRQKQHIQYHDQWPSLAGKCHKRTLNFCASVLPFNTTTFPNIIGDNNRFEVKRSLPFFGFLAKSSCNKRLDELLCLLLEPPCNSNSGLAIPPCKKFCRLALEGCNEYIPATLAMSSVFDCRQYPDSNDASVCINLARGSKCAQDEFKCPDETYIPREYRASLARSNQLLCFTKPSLTADPFHNSQAIGFATESVIASSPPMRPTAQVSRFMPSDSQDACSSRAACLANKITFSLAKWPFNRARCGA